MITIICATYNAAGTLDDFFSSVRKQTCKDFELIMIDGASSDNTNQIIENNQDIISNYISEPDNGIYDAWNKGIKMASNDWICFVGADDIILPDFVKIYSDTIESNRNQDLDYISSKVNYIDSKGRTIFTMGKEWKWKEFRWRMTTAHVGSLHHKNLFREVGYYNTDYKIVGDYELLLRKKDRLSAIYVDRFTINMRAGGVSISLAALKERYRAQRRTAKLNILETSLLFIYGVYSLNRLTSKIEGEKYTLDETIP